MKLTHKHYLQLAIVSGLIALIAIILSSCSTNTDSELHSVFSRHRYIGHAFGEIDGNTYTNSYEAFKANYEKGRRVFEVDFAITSDRAVVCFHEGSEKQFGLSKNVRSMTYREFKDAKILGKYTTMDINDIIKIMQEHSDIYLVTDVKRDLQDFLFIIAEVVQKAYKTDPKIAERIIPQVYDEATYANAMFLYRFKEVIYTLYRTNRSDDQVIDFLKKNENITGLTVSRDRFNPNLAKSAVELGRAVFVHTINDPNEMKSFRERGAYGFYTDNYYENRKARN